MTSIFSLGAQGISVRQTEFGKVEIENPQVSCFRDFEYGWLIGKLCNYQLSFNIKNGDSFFIKTLINGGRPDSVKKAIFNTNFQCFTKVNPDKLNGMEGIISRTEEGINDGVKEKIKQLDKENYLYARESWSFQGCGTNTVINSKFLEIKIALKNNKIVSFGVKRSYTSNSARPAQEKRYEKVIFNYNPSGNIQSIQIYKDITGPMIRIIMFSYKNKLLTQITSNNVRKGEPDSGLQEESRVQLFYTGALVKYKLLKDIRWNSKQKFHISQSNLDSIVKLSKKHTKYTAMLDKLEDQDDASDRRIEKTEHKLEIVDSLLELRSDQFRNYDNNELNIVAYEYAKGKLARQFNINIRNDDLDQMITQIDSVFYDKRGSIVKITNSGEHSIFYSYNPKTNKLLSRKTFWKGEADSVLRVEYYTYDKEGRMIQISGKENVKYENLTYGNEWLMQFFYPSIKSEESP